MRNRQRFHRHGVKITNRSTFQIHHRHHPRRQVKHSHSHTHTHAHIHTPTLAIRSCAACLPFNATYHVPRIEQSTVTRFTGNLILYVCVCRSFDAFVLGRAKFRRRRVQWPPLSSVSPYFVRNSVARIAMRQAARSVRGGQGGIGTLNC